MVGRTWAASPAGERAGSGGRALLELARGSRRGRFHDVDLSVHAGEIVGLAGLVGAGRSELARAIFGLDRIDSGAMRLDGRPWRPSHPRQAIEAGLVYVPEERKRQGLVLVHSLAHSISIGFTDRLTRLGIIRRRREREQVAACLPRYDIRAASPRQPVGTLSGGNQQKALLARWLQRDPKLIILDEPTRGVDVGAKAQIHALIAELARRGKGVLCVSSDFSEIVAIAHRVLVMNRGTIEVELCGDEQTEHNVILAASGLYRGRAPQRGHSA
jgi:ABC-type sugar transport system ATPase subunit